MTALILQHLESLQLDLVAIDPAHHSEAADCVATIAAKLREAMREAVGPAHSRADTVSRQRTAA